MGLKAKVVIPGILLAGMLVYFVVGYDEVGHAPDHFEVPVYSKDRESIKDLTGGRFSDIDELRSGLEASLAGIDFKPYLKLLNKKVAKEKAIRIMEEGYRLRGNPVWKTDDKFDWAHDPQGDRNWRFQMNAFDHLEPFVAVYPESSDEKLFSIVKNGVFDWIEYNLLQNGENVFKWHDMATGIRATHLAFLYYYGITRGLLSSGELRTLLAVMDMHVEVLANPRLLSRGNHGLFQMLGLASICHVADILASCGGGMLFAQEKFQEIARGQFTSEGIHAEHSSQYHAWAIKTIETMLQLGYFDNIDVRFLGPAKANIVHYFYPDGGITLLGDTGSQNICSVRKLHEFAEFLCSHGKSGRQPDVSSLAFMNSGYAVVRSDWDERPLRNQSYFFFNGAYHSHVHKQSDDFTFVWYERGMPILVDSGKYSYDSDEWRQYVISTRAHNTVEIDGADYPTSSRDAYGSALKGFTRFDDTYLVLAETFRKKSDVNHRRLIAVQPGKFLLVIDQMAGAKQHHQYRQWFHFHEALEVEREESGLIHISNNSRERLASGILYASTGHSSQLVKGRKEPQIQGWISRHYMRMEPNYALSNEADGGNLVLAAGFSLAEQGQKHSLMIDQAISGSVRFCFGASQGVQVDIDKAVLTHVQCAVH